MTTYLSQFESARLQAAEPEGSSHPAPAPEKHTVIEVELPAPAGPANSLAVVAVRSFAARRLTEEMPVDLAQEGVNMLELQMRQSRCLTPLSISSKATQALLRQF